MTAQLSPVLMSRLPPKTPNFFGRLHYVWNTSEKRPLGRLRRRRNLDFGVGHWRSSPDPRNSGLSRSGDQTWRNVGQTSREIYEEFQIGKDGGRWDALPDEGYIRFTLEDGRTSYASYGVAASWAEHSHSWLWSWAMPKGWVHPNAQVVSKRAHDFGQDQCWDALTTKSLLVNEMEAWNLTKLVAHASDMPLVYRAKVNDINWHYFALSRPSWSN